MGSKSSGGPEFSFHPVFIIYVLFLNLTLGETTTLNNDIQIQIEALKNQLKEESEERLANATQKLGEKVEALENELKEARLLVSCTRVGFR